MRPIWYNYPTATDTFGIETSFMLGDTLLVIPVIEEGQRQVDAFFPAGDKWYQLDHHETDAYHTEATISAGEDEDIPTFIRGGSLFVVRDRIRRSSTLMENDPVTLIIALDQARNAAGDVYFDDGITHDYQKGELSYKTVKFEQNRLNYSDHKESGTYQNARATIEKIEIYGWGKTAPSLIEISEGPNWKRLDSRVVGNTLVVRKPAVKATGNFELRITP